MKHSNSDSDSDSDISRREEGFRGEARDIENDVVNGGNLFHPGPGMLDGGVAEAEDGGDGSALVGDEEAVDVSVVGDGAADGGLPVNGVVGVGGVDPGEVGVLHVDEEAAPLAEVAVEHVTDHLRGAFVALHHRRPVRRHF